MSIVTLVLILIVVGVALWLITTYVPMNRAIKSLIIAVVLIALLIWILQMFGLWGHIYNIKVK